MTVRLGREALSLSDENTVIAIGNFDGVHIGHRQLFEEALRKKEQLENEESTPCKVLVMTFWPHPRQFFKDPSFKLIYSKEHRDALILETGKCDRLVTLPFHKELMELSCEDFFNRILMENCHAKAVIVGDNFHFGKDGKGDSSLLKALCLEKGIDAVIVPRVTYQGQAVSSSRIREAIKEGRMEEAGAMLGQPYSLEGTVAHGKGVGHLLNTPTVNLMFDPDLEMPKEGVYLSRTNVDGNRFNSISNVGTNPTFGAEAFRAETNLFDYTGDLYGKRITVELLRFMRPEITFADATALKTQLEKDIKAAKAEFERGN